MDMMGGMSAMLLIGLLLLAALIAAAVYVAVRAARAGEPRQVTPRETLQRRLAAGDITPEDFFERESALRDAEPARRRR